MIPAKTKVGARAKSEEAPKLRVAAYCRVSTETDEQATSYEAQIEHYTDYIEKHPGWELAGIYADDGISGTNTKKREEFNRLIEDCMAGRIDINVTLPMSDGRGAFIFFAIRGEHEIKTKIDIQKQEEPSMPKTKFESVIFTVVAAWIMVYIMTFYSTVLEISTFANATIFTLKGM